MVISSTLADTGWSSKLCYWSCYYFFYTLALFNHLPHFDGAKQIHCYIYLNVVHD